MIIQWMQVIVVTLVLYALMIITLPFNQQYSMMFLYAIIAYWSRLPGVGIPVPLYILYNADMVDLISCIVAVNVGGIQGAMLSVFGNIASRMAGFTPEWPGVIKDTLLQFLICLIIPFIHAVTGADIVVTMVIYTVIRRIGFIIVHLVYPQYSHAQYIFVWTGTTLANVAVNWFYAVFFGRFFDSLIHSGKGFRWDLFLAVTVIILIGRAIFFGFEKKEGGKKNNIARNVAKIIVKKKEDTSRFSRINDDDFVREAGNNMKFE